MILMIGGKVKESMIDIWQIQHHLHLVKQREGLIGGSLHVSSLEGEERNIDARISFKNFVIDFNVNPRLDELWDSDENIKRYCQRRGIDDVVGEACETVLLHEVWHWKKEELTGKIGCPTDAPNLMRNVDAAYRALKDKGFFKDADSEEQKERYASDFAGMFDDLLVNSNLGYEGLSDTLSVVYYDMGIKRKVYAPLGEGFLKLQMAVFGSPEDKDLVSVFYTADEEKSKAIDGVVERTLSEMGMKDKPLSEMIAEFRKIERWKDLVYKFTYNMCDLYDKSQNGQGGGSKSDSHDKKGNQTMPIAVSLDHELSEKEEEEGLVKCYGKKGSPPDFMQRNKVLRLAYSHLAHDVVIKSVTRMTGLEMPIAPLTEQRFESAEHDVREIDFSRPRIDVESEFGGVINFTVPEDHYTVIASHTRKENALPNIMWLIDCSGTMNDGKEEFVFGVKDAWRVDSKYHYALLGVNGSVKWLRSQRIAPYIKYNVTLFSNSTETSGWQSYGTLDKALEVCWNPQFGGTHIDMKVLAPELMRDPSVIIFLSDGDIHNWKEIKDEFFQATRPHKLSFIQIKGRTTAGRDVASWGNPVYDIDQAQDLDRLIIDLTKQTYNQVRGL